MIIAILFIAFLALLGVIITIAAIIEILSSSFKNPNDKLVWLLVVIFVHLIGAILYFAIGRQQRVQYY